MTHIYFYGEQGQEEFRINDFKEAIRDVWDCMNDLEEFRIVIELKVSKKSDAKWCRCDNVFIEAGYCGNLNCENYTPRNGKNGMCEHQSWGLIETGRKWKVFLDGSFKKISGRKK